MECKLALPGSDFYADDFSSQVAALKSAVKLRKWLRHTATMVGPEVLTVRTAFGGRYGSSWRLLHEPRSGRAC